ncbi:MAG: indolepyruvate oxidoreductase subunit beta [Eubacteriales bacterium]|nr:indolepyruvate oxidoreductase subunit beta [Eubacteriales bacterium]
MTSNIMLVGVGGQGTILVSKLLTIGLLECGYDVKMSEIHGMSQRGGSVSSQVRYGDRVYSPVIEMGSADVLISFELMETLRWLDYLRPGGKIIVNDLKIASLPILTGKQEYPADIDRVLKEAARTYIIPASEQAEKLGNVKVMNIILFGTIAKIMELEDIDWDNIISKNLPGHLVDINLKAFKTGMGLLE